MIWFIFYNFRMKNDIVVKKFGKFVTMHVLYTHAIYQFLADEETSGASVRAYTVPYVRWQRIVSRPPVRHRHRCTK